MASRARYVQKADDPPELRLAFEAAMDALAESGDDGDEARWPEPLGALARAMASSRVALHADVPLGAFFAPIPFSTRHVANGFPPLPLPLSGTGELATCPSNDVRIVFRASDASERLARWRASAQATAATLQHRHGFVRALTPAPQLVLRSLTELVVSIARLHDASTPRPPPLLQPSTHSRRLVTLRWACGVTPAAREHLLHSAVSAHRLEREFAALVPCPLPHRRRVCLLLPTSSGCRRHAPATVTAGTGAPEPSVRLLVAAIEAADRPAGVTGVEAIRLMLSALSAASRDARTAKSVPRVGWVIGALTPPETLDVTFDDPATLEALRAHPTLDDAMKRVRDATLAELADVDPAAAARIPDAFASPLVLALADFLLCPGPLAATALFDAWSPAALPAPRALVLPEAALPADKQKADGRVTRADLRYLMRAPRGPTEVAAARRKLAAHVAYRTDDVFPDVDGGGATHTVSSLATRLAVEPTGAAADWRRLLSIAGREAMDRAHAVRAAEAAAHKRQPIADPAWRGHETGAVDISCVRVLESPELPAPAAFDLPRLRLPSPTGAVDAGPQLMSFVECVARVFHTLPADTPPVQLLSAAYAIEALLALNARSFDGVACLETALHVGGLDKAAFARRPPLADDGAAGQEFGELRAEEGDVCVRYRIVRLADHAPASAGELDPSSDVPLTYAIDVRFASRSDRDFLLTPALAALVVPPKVQGCFSLLRTACVLAGESRLILAHPPGVAPWNALRSAAVAQAHLASALLAGSGRARNPLVVDRSRIDAAYQRVSPQVAAVLATTSVPCDGSG